MAASAGDASGQTSRITVQPPGDPSTSAPAARDAFGQPCLAVRAIAREHAVNPDVLDHVVTVMNHCPKTITVSICYFGSDRCSRVDVRAYGRSDTILGTMAGIRFFRYSVTELNALQPAGPIKSFTYNPPR